ncbi:MAG: SpoIIE family protein phosphatase [Acidobacteriota bacterium]
MSSKAETFFFAAAAVIGLVLTALAMERWAPESLTRLPAISDVARAAAADSQALGYRLSGEPHIRVTNGHRQYHASMDIQALSSQVSDPTVRRQLLEQVPPLRVGARYWRAESPRGREGALFLEYDGDARLIAAIFGVAGGPAESLGVEADRFVADRLARLILGEEPGEPQVWSDAVRTELIYRPRDDEPAVYVALSSQGSWMAMRTPVPYRVAGRQSFTRLFFGDLATQIRFYVVFACALLALGVLLWRLGQRRAGLSHALPVLVVLVALALPTLRHFQARSSVFFAIALAYVLTQLGLLLAWSVAEAEVREVRPGSTEHWDRILRRRPTRATGGHLIRGVAFGCGLSALLASSGAVASWLGDGGYGALSVVLPDYWLLTTPVHWGFAMAATTAFIVGLGGRLGRRVGAMVAATVASCAWGYMTPVTPVSANLAVAWLASMAAGWLLWHYGILALVTACITAFSLPTAWVSLRVAPTLMWDSALPSLVPLVFLAIGLGLRRWAPSLDDLPVAPAYVSQLENETRLRAQVGLLREFQLALLPPDDHASPRVDLAWRMVPADVVGGDFLDVVEDDDGRLWLAIADVAGHGVSCSVLTAYTKAAVAEHAAAGRSALDALQSIRRLFSRLETTRSLVTTLLAVWDPERRTLQVASAGHPHLLLVSGDRVREIGASSPPLCSGLPARDRQVEVNTEPGDVVVLYTDGVVEAASPTGEELGFGRWPELLPNLRTLPATKMLQALIADVDRHRAGRPAGDDVTALVAKLG